MPNSTTIRSGVDGRLAAVERDQAVTNTRLNTLTDNVQTLATTVETGFEKIESMLGVHAASSAVIGRFTTGQITAGVLAVVTVGGSLLVGGRYYVQSELERHHASLRIESIRREAQDRINNERLRLVGSMPDTPFAFEPYETIGDTP